MHERARLGAEGEAKAADWLKTQGYEILEQNLRTRTEEVDIVSRHNGILVFVEVKTWQAWGPEDLERIISPTKRRKLFRAAERFRCQRNLLSWPVRFDVIFADPNTGCLRHIPNAFTETGLP